VSTGPVYQVGRTFLGRLALGADLLAFLRQTAVDNGVRLATVRAFGAVQNAVFAFVDQHTRCYHAITLNENLELLNLTGRFSWNDGEPELHAHVTLSDAEGHAFGGHLLPGTIIFAGEYWVQELLERAGQ